MGLIVERFLAQLEVWGGERHRRVLTLYGIDAPQDCQSPPVATGMARLPLLALLLLLVLAAPAAATPVCTDGYKGGPPLASCGGRIFPEAHNAQAYIQYTPNP